MEAGTRNEPRVLEGLLDFAHRHRANPLWISHSLPLTIESSFVRTVGLMVASKEEHWLATSVDGLMVVTISPSLRVISEHAQALELRMADGETEHLTLSQERAATLDTLVVAVEIKTRTTVLTIAALHERALDPDPLHPLRTGSVCAVVMLDHSDDAMEKSVAEYRRVIPLASERQQVRKPTVVYTSYINFFFSFPIYF